MNIKRSHQLKEMKGRNIKTNWKSDIQSEAKWKRKIKYERNK